MTWNEGESIPSGPAVLRPVGLVLAAIIVTTLAIVMEGWGSTSAALGVIIALLSGLVLLQVIRAVRRYHGISGQIQVAAIRAERHYVDVLRRIVHFVEGREKHNRGHSAHVGELSEKLAHQMCLPKELCSRLHLAGELHDVGLLAVEDEVLKRRSWLGVDEFRTIKKHPQVAYEILRPLRSLEDVLEAVRYHHERMNGTGYPVGLSGEDIPLTARILAVADAYDAMTHDRPHRAAMTPLEAYRELRRCCPAGYDSRCVDALAEVCHLPALQEAMDHAREPGVR